jgi:hypothetical protein
LLLLEFRDSASLLHPDVSSSSSALPLPAGASAAGGSGLADIDGGAPAGDPNASFYQLAYYQGYFDVTTPQILDRLMRAYFPFRGKFYRDDDGTGSGRAEQADLYGPFWICTTLIFLLAAAGNFANYIQFINDPTQGPGSGSGSSESTDSEGNVVSSGVWTYDFRKVTIGASVFYAWISVVPLALYCFFKHTGGNGAAAAVDGGVSDASAAAAVPRKGIVEIASLFGYALAWLLPVCLICIPPLALVRWVSVGVAFVMSSLFLLTNLAMMDVGNKTLLPAIIAVVALNFAIALLTKFYFFDF